MSGRVCELCVLLSLEGRCVGLCGLGRCTVKSKADNDRALGLGTQATAGTGDPFLRLRWANDSLSACRGAEGGGRCIGHGHTHRQTLSGQLVSVGERVGRCVDGKASVGIQGFNGR